MKKIVFVLAVLIGMFTCVSCDSEVKIDLKKDGNVALKFSGTFGDGLSKLVNSISDDDVVFDTKAITYELSKSGFVDVIVTARGKKSLEITMNERGQKSYLFTSGMLSTKGNKVSLKLSPETLEKFYSFCDEQIVLYLDLLLAPVFNSEKMSEAEYLETIAAFYGQSVADEFSKSFIHLTVMNPDGKSKTSVLSVAKLLTLNEVLIVE